MSSENLIDIVMQYQEAAKGTSHPNATMANKWHDKLHICYKQLRDTDEGRSAIASLISDVNPYIRLWAASHSLNWAPSIARSALESLRDSKSSCSFTAEMTLKEFDKGTLSFDY